MTVSFQQPPPPQSQPQPQPEQPPQPQPQQPPQPQRTIKKFIVEVVDARDLLPKDGQGSSSAYVVADFDGQRKRTATKYKDLNPVWNEPLEFVVSDPDNMDYEEPSIEVKPGKPFTHKPGDYNGRLHISMATLGLGTATKRSTLQCNVGNKSPVYLCCLYPKKNECLQLHLEFDEADEVMFSVLGPCSVHLAG